MTKKIYYHGHVNSNEQPHIRAIGSELRYGIFKQAIEISRTRLLITGVIMSLAFIIIALRLIDIGAFKIPKEPRNFYAISMDSEKKQRGDIVDRNGQLIATSLKSVSLAANPQKINNPQEVAVKLAAIIPSVSVNKLIKSLTSKNKFVWLKRKLTPNQHWQINKLGIPGLKFINSESRIYPQGPLMGHILGYVDIDNRGLSGIEKTFDKPLRNNMEQLQLTIDMRMQYIMREELSNAIDEYRAIGGAGIILDVNNGEVISMVSLPDFDPNHPSNSNPQAIFNRATLGVYELGSTFKIFNTALALETGISNMKSGYDARKPIKISRFLIRDFHAKKRILSVPEIFIYSSNIGSALMAKEIGTAAQKTFMKNIGFLDKLDIELPEIGHPQYPKIWRPINTMTIAYGHGLAISPMHLAAGVASMVNGGIVTRPTLIKSNISNDNSHQNNKQHIISTATSKAIRKLMRLNNIAGSGKRSDAKGYLVGGKTGSAEKPGINGYNKKSLISSYVAAFPMNDPKYVVYIILDEPHGNEKTYNSATGGWVAAPSVKNIIKRIAPLAGIMPVDNNATEIINDFIIENPSNNIKILASF